nr:hypothetical protein [Tanacetum cinerariifolium]
MIFVHRKGSKESARTLQQNGVAERRNRTLIEAARTMLADAKLPVTFWAEAVNTACYVQNRVLVNKSQNKAPYELFNGRTPAIGFLKPFGCHVMILNTLDNLGKFDAKGDEVETPIPLETLTVETPIPTVSSPIPTACLNDSLEPSSDTRLISKRVANQVETPSLDNILTLTNRFEDILEVITNSVDSDGVEAYVSYMETTITASPTSTLRIHKDHPKIQIISPMDTPIQTRNKSKEDPEFPAKVYKVEKAMYGLHQAPRAWQRGDFILVQVYVDDIIFGSSNPQLCREFEALMHEKFQMSTMGELNFFLGLQVLQKKDGIFSLQTNRTRKDVDLHLYRSMIGSLMYLTASRPDIMFAVYAYARHKVTPKEYHLHADRKSTTGGCQFFGRRLISWQCKKHTIVATSTPEAEYVAAASCCGQVQWIQNQLLNYGNKIMARLQFCDYHNMVAILEKSEHNVDFHPIVDFVEASPLRIETTEKETNILATVDGILRTVTESSLRRNLKLQDEEGIITTALIPTVTPSDTPPLRQYTRRASIAQFSTLPPVADEPVSPLRDVSQGEACPTDSGFGAEQDRANIAKTSTLPYDSAPRVTSPAVDEGSMQQTLNELTALCTSLQRQHSEMVSKFEAQELEINMLKVRIKLLEDREGGGVERSGINAPIKGRNLDEREATAKRVSDDTEEMATVLTSMDATTVLASGVAKVPTGSGSIPTAVTPYTRKKGKETMVESETLKKKKVQEQIDAQVARELEKKMAREDQRMSVQVARDAEIARIHAEEELQIMIDGLDKKNETVAKYLQEYHQFASELPFERRIELISDLVRYQDNYAKVYKYQSQQRKPWSKKQKRDYYMAVIKCNLGWKESAKKLKTSEEVPEEVKSPDKVPEEKVKEMMQLVPIEKVYVEALQVKHLIIDWKVHTEGQRSYWKVTRLGGSSASYQFFVNMLKHLDREDLNQLWALAKESLIIRPPNIEWKLYDMCGVHQVTSKDKEIFMPVEKDYPLRKGLAIGMISYKLQVETYSKMANDLILKIYKIANSPRQQAMEFPLPEEVPTASEESSHYQKKRVATAVKIALLLKSRRNCQSKSYDSFTKLVPHVSPCILGITVIVTSCTRTHCPIKGVL